jgi:hypothetical protein
MRCCPTNRLEVSAERTQRHCKQDEHDCGPLNEYVRDSPPVGGYSRYTWLCIAHWIFLSPCYR